MMKTQMMQKVKIFRWTSLYSTALKCVTTYNVFQVSMSALHPIITSSIADWFKGRHRICAHIISGHTFERHIVKHSSILNFCTP